MDGIKFIYFFLLLLVPLVSYLRINCLIQDYKILLLELYSFSSYTLISITCFNFWIWYEVEVQLHFSAFVYPVAQHHLLKRLYFPLLHCLDIPFSLKSTFREFHSCRYPSLWSYYFSNYQAFYYFTWTSKSLKQTYAIFTLFQLGQSLTFKNIYQVPTVIGQAVF